MSYKIALAVLTLAAPLAAQQRMMEGPVMPHMGPVTMGIMLYAPQQLLARKEALSLTPDQVSRLTVLRDAMKTTHDAAMANAKERLEAMEPVAHTGQLDTVALKAHFQAAHAAIGEAHWAMLASAVRAQAVLTDAQRAKVQVWADSMQAWRQQHRQMMNPNRP